MIFLIILLVIAAPLATLKYLGVRSMRPVSIDIGGLPLDRIVEIGTKASHSLARRLFGRPEAQATPDGGAVWFIHSGGGVMTVEAHPLPDGDGYQVVACATKMRVAQVGGVVDHTTDWGRAKILTNWLFRLLGIPHNPRKLLRQRRRVLRSLRRAGQVIAPAAPTQEIPSPQHRSELPETH